MKFRSLIFIINLLIVVQTSVFASTYSHIIQFENNSPKLLVINWQVLPDGLEQQFRCENAKQGYLIVKSNDTITLGCESGSQDSAGKRVLSTVYSYDHDKAVVVFGVGGTYNRFQPDDNTFSLGEYDCDVGGEMTTLVQCLSNKMGVAQRNNS